MKTPLYFAAALPGLFVIGGISGVMLAVFPVDWQLHDSYFVVAHLHYVLFGGSVFGIFAGVYYWFPKMSGRMMSEGLGKVSFWVMFVGFNLTFLIQHSAGLSGMPRRIYDYPEDAGWAVFNLVSTIGSFMLGIGVLLTRDQRAVSRSSTASAPATTRGRATRWSGSPSRRRRTTTSTWFRACARSSR